MGIFPIFPCVWGNKKSDSFSYTVHTVYFVNNPSGSSLLHRLHGKIYTDVSHLTESEPLTESELLLPHVNKQNILERNGYLVAYLDNYI